MYFCWWGTSIADVSGCALSKKSLERSRPTSTETIRVIISCRVSCWKLAVWRAATTGYRGPLALFLLVFLLERVVLILSLRSDMNDGFLIEGVNASN